MENPLNAAIFVALVIIAVVALIFAVVVCIRYVEPQRSKPGVRRQPTPTVHPMCTDADTERAKAARLAVDAAREAMLK